MIIRNIHRAQTCGCVEPFARHGGLAIDRFFLSALVASIFVFWNHPVGDLATRTTHVLHRYHWSVMTVSYPPGESIKKKKVQRTKKLRWLRTRCTFLWMLFASTMVKYMPEVATGYIFLLLLFRLSWKHRCRDYKQSTAHKYTPLLGQLRKLRVYHTKVSCCKHVANSWFVYLFLLHRPAWLLA